MKAWQYSETRPFVIAPVMLGFYTLYISDGRLIPLVVGILSTISGILLCGTKVDMKNPWAPFKY